MKIAVNLCTVRPGQIGGAEKFIRDLLSELLTQEADHTYLYLTANYNDSSFKTKNKRVKKKIVYHENPTASPYTLRAKFRMNNTNPATKLLWNERADVLFCPFGALEPEVTFLPSIVTIHDIQHEYFPENFTENELNWRRNFYKVTAEKATLISPISNYTAQTVKEKLKVPSERIHTIFEGFKNDDIQSPSPEVLGGLRKKYVLSEDSPILFFPANLWPHKNHKTLIHAFKLILDQQKEEKKALPVLLLTGSKPNNGVDVMTMSENLGIKRHVRYPGYVQRSEIIAFYFLANMLVYPSLFEGFGIPIAEAMAVGCPVIAGRISSIPEVAGKAACYVDPTNPNEIAEGVCELIDNIDLRNTLIAEGRKQVAALNFDHTVEEYLKLFESVKEVHASREYNNDWTVDKIWPDGWSGPRLCIISPTQLVSEGYLTLNGELPDVRALFPMTIKLFVDGKLMIKEKFLHPGAFSRTLPLAHHRCLISINASRSFIPSQFGTSTDSRELSVIWESIIFKNRNNEEYIVTGSNGQ